MKLGPKALTEKLEDLMKRLEFLVEPSLKFLQSHSDRIEVFHRAALVHSMRGEFNLVFIVLSSGKSLTGVTLSDPFTRSPSPYRMAVDHERVSKEIGECMGWVPEEIKSGVFDFPPRTRFLAVVGPDEVLEKELFQERIKGKEIVSFASKVDDDVLEEYLRLKGRMNEGTSISVDDEGIHVAIFKPSWLPQEHVSLFSEMARVIRGHLGLKPSKFSKFSKAENLVAVVTLPLEELWRGKVEDVVKDLKERLRFGYEGFLKGAGLI